MQKRRIFHRSVPLVVLTVVLLVSLLSLPASAAPTFAPDPRIMGFTPTASP
jgi:hypothetical protein